MSAQCLPECARYGGTAPEAQHAPGCQVYSEMMMRALWADASTGLDGSPGDPISKWAARRIRELEAAMARARDPRCSVCGGDGENPSGIECICGGTGRLVDAEQNCRKRILETEAERDSIAGQLADNVRAYTEYRNRQEQGNAGLIEIFSWTTKITAENERLREGLAKATEDGKQAAEEISRLSAGLGASNGQIALLRMVMGEMCECGWATKFPITGESGVETVCTLCHYERVEHENQKLREELARVKRVHEAAELSRRLAEKERDERAQEARDNRE